MAASSPGSAPTAGLPAGEAEQLRAELRAVARDLLTTAAPTPGEGGSADTTEVGWTEVGWTEVDWTVAAGAGWLGLEVPEVFDGAGATFAETAVVCEELGRAAARAPYLGTAVLAAGALGALAPGPGRDELLRTLAAGAPRLTVALPTDDDAVGLPDLADAVPFRLAGSAGSAGGLRVTGRADFVPDVAGAGTLLLVALDEDGVPVVVRVRPGLPGLDVAETPLLDLSRSLGNITATDVTVPTGDVWRFAGDGALAVRLLLARGALAVAADSLGAAEAMLDATVGYARVRQQFGRPIGSFQAVKHGCADMLIQVSVGRALVTDAVHACAAADTTTAVGVAAVEVAVSRAKSHVGAAAVDVAGKAMQLHGGIGYTWESGIHRYLKRATLNRALFGSPAAHRARLAPPR
jgi:alkylation response protein AidB-like acyl-CoA dehydrogenase